MPSDTFLSRLQYRAHATLARLSYGMAGFSHPLRREMWKECLRGIGTTTTPLECSEIWQWAKACENVPGDMAELGVYNGATAAIMLKAAPSKKIHLFDTFAGLPGSEGKFEKGEWNGSLDSVKRNLARWNGRADYHVGLFPYSAAQCESIFSFVHLDADLYLSTKAGLEWFWPRLSLGGAVLSHDYPLSNGVVKAFHEFIEGRDDLIFVPLSGSNCIAIKTNQ